MYNVHPRNVNFTNNVMTPPDPGMTSDGETYYINASTCNRQYRAVQDCIVFDVPNGPFEQGTCIVNDKKKGFTINDERNIL